MTAPAHLPQPTDDADPMRVANTILEQIGGRQFIAMTGAHSFVGRPLSLTFALPRYGENGANRVCILLDLATDTYEVMFSKRRGPNHTPLGSVSMVYADQLRAVFTNHTGLQTRLY